MVQESRLWPKAKKNFLRMGKAVLVGHELPIIRGVQVESVGMLEKRAFHHPCLRCQKNKCFRVPPALFSAFLNFIVAKATLCSSAIFQRFGFKFLVETSVCLYSHLSKPDELSLKKLFLWIPGAI